MLAYEREPIGRDGGESMLWFVIGGVAVVLAGLVAFVIVRRKRRNNGPIHAIVMLLEKPRKLSEKGLRDAVERALTPEERQGYEVVFEEGMPGAMLMLRSGLVLVNSFPQPYGDAGNADVSHLPIFVGRAMQLHRAWMSVDHMGDVEEQQRDAVYSRLGRIAAELWPPECCLLYATESTRVAMPTPETRELFRKGQTLEAFTWENFPSVPVVGIAGNDPDILAAAEEARRRFPEFLAAWSQQATAKGEQHFAVKAPFTEDDNTEHMWVTVKRIDGDRLTGVLDSDPRTVSFKSGAVVTVLRKDIEDWVYMKDGKPVGMLSVNIVAERMRG
jgi:LPXTG-motif cell wall-anchored protein